MSTTSPFRVKPLVHILAWSLFLFVPALAGLQSHEPHLHFPLRDLFRIGFLAAVFYLNYFWLIPQLFLNGHRRTFLLINLGLAIFLFFGFQWVQPGPPPMNPDGPPLHPHGRSSIIHAFGAFTLVALTTGMAIAIRLTELWIKDQKVKSLLETEHLKSELSYLKLQLSPHFLFNTLNNI